MSDLRSKVRRSMVEAISDYNMLSEGDRVLVAVSGGKDSAVLLSLLEETRTKAPFTFTIHPVIVDQKQPGFSVDAFKAWVGSLGMKLEVIEEDTYSTVVEKTEAGKAYCSLCSRLRRGILYTHAKKNGYTKIALGHHRDDLNETILLNLFYSGKIASMPPKLTADDGENVVIRPLCYVPESWLTGLSVQMRIPIIPCNLCGSQDGLKRQKVKQLLQTLEAEHAHIGASMLTAQQNIRPSQLSDKSLWTF